MNLNNLVDVHAHLLKRLSLCNSSGEAVENEAVLCVVLCDSVLEDTDYNFVRNEVASVHIRLSSKTSGCAVLDRLAEHIASGDSRDIQLFADYLSLGTLTCARSA